MLPMQLVGHVEKRDQVLFGTIGIVFFRGQLDVVTRHKEEIPHF